MNDETSLSNTKYEKMENTIDKNNQHKEEEDSKIKLNASNNLLNQVSTSSKYYHDNHNKININDNNLKDMVKEKKTLPDSDKIIVKRPYTNNPYHNNYNKDIVISSFNDEMNDDNHENKNMYNKNINSSFSFRDKRKSKLSKSILQTNFSTKVTEFDSYLDYSKTPQTVFRNPKDTDMDLLVNPENAKDLFAQACVDFNNNKYQDANFNTNISNDISYNNFYLNNQSPNLQPYKSQTSIFKGVNSIRNSQINKVSNTNNIINNINTLNEINSNNINDFNNVNNINNPIKETNNSIIYSNSLGEKMYEESPIERTIRICFSIYIPSSLIQQVTSSPGYSSIKPNPIIIKELLSVKNTDSFIPIIKDFLLIVNKQIKNLNMRLLDFEEAIKTKHNNNIKIEDQTVYLPKYMKSSGKPDYDLPGFDLKTSIELFKIDKFALSFEPQCLVSTKKLATQKFKSSTTNIISAPLIVEDDDDSSDDESSDDFIMDSNFNRGNNPQISTNAQTLQSGRNLIKTNSQFNYNNNTNANNTNLNNISNEFINNVSNNINASNEIRNYDDSSSFNNDSNINLYHNNSSNFNNNSNNINKNSLKSKKTNKTNNINSANNINNTNNTNNNSSIEQKSSCCCDNCLIF